MENNYVKFVITCKPHNQPFLDRVLWKTVDFQVWAPENIDDIKNLVDTRVYQIISSKSEEKIHSTPGNEIHSNF